MRKKQVLKRWLLRLSTILLPVSIGLVIVSLTTAMLSDFPFPRFAIPVFSLACGAFLWFSGTMLKNRLRFFFAAILLTLTGTLLLLVDVGVLALPMPRVWPFLMLIIAVSFLASGTIEYRRPRAVFVVPALAFGVLGSVFLLFSIHIIPGSIVSLVFVWFPLLALPTVVSVLIWLSRMQHYGRHKNE